MLLEYQNTTSTVKINATKKDLILRLDLLTINFFK